jgi:hypothetical protein
MHEYIDIFIYAYRNSSKKIHRERKKEKNEINVFNNIMFSFAIINALLKKICIYIYI